MKTKTTRHSAKSTAQQDALRDEPPALPPARLCGYCRGRDASTCQRHQYSPGDVVEVRPAYRMGAAPGAGYTAPDGNEGVWTVIRQNGVDLALKRGYWDRSSHVLRSCVEVNRYDMWISAARCTPVKGV